MWVLDSLADSGKMSSIQVAIMLEYVKRGEEPTRITSIMKSLEENFKGLWEPKKGTIYPSVHNLNVRGYLKLHAIKPYGYSITDKGLETINNIIAKISVQMKLYLRYFEFFIENIAEIDEKKAQEKLVDLKEIIKSFEKFQLKNKN